jgi:glycosyltransferase involved in cell wall biosynthesis
MRVLMVAPTPFFGDRGCHVRIFEEARALARHGVDCEIVTYAAGGDVKELEIRRSRRIPGIAPSELGPSYSRPFLDAHLLRTASGVARAFQPDIIHGHLHEGILIGAWLRHRLSVPLVADLQGSATEELVDHGFLSARGPLTSVVRRVERWLVKRADAVVVSSRTAAKIVVNQGGQADRVFQLLDGVDLDRFYPAPADAALRTELGLDGKLVVVFLGVLTKYQGIDSLIEAVPHVLAHVPNAHFLIMGYPNVEKYRAKVLAAGLQHAVTLPGRIAYEDAPRYLRLGHIAVSGKRSLTEANGKLLNYMGCGLPVVASDIPVNRDMLGPEGIFAAADDPVSFAGQICALLIDPERQARVGRLLRQRAESLFSWNTRIEPLLSVYDTALARGLARHAAQPEPAPTS